MTGLSRITIDSLHWRGLPAWRIVTAELEVVVTRLGAQIAALQLPGCAINPLWQPGWPASHPAALPADAEAVYGSGPEASLLAGIVGHNLCLDRFGGPWPETGIPVHGEAGAVDWQLREVATGARLVANLPISGLAVTRDLTIAGAELTITTQVVPVDGRERHIEWAEHITLGDPFLAGADCQAVVDGAWLWPMDALPDARFDAAPGAAVAAEHALAMPAEHAPAAGDIVTMRSVDGAWSATNHSLDRRLTCTWSTATFPWLCVWTEHHSRAEAPWHGHSRARGLEVSTKPFPEAAPPPERQDSWQQRSTTCRVPGDGLQAALTMRWERASSA